MAVTSGTITNVQILRDAPIDVGGLKWAFITFTMTGTYAQADDSIISSVTTSIENSTRNGKIVSLVDAMPAQAAAIASAPATYMSTKTVTISTNDITFELTLNDHATEYTNATAIVAQANPFGILVAYTEA